jgi:hypothetical protein
MIRFIFSLTLMFFLFTPLCKAQFDAKLTVGEEFKPITVQLPFNGIIGSDETGIYILSANPFQDNTILIDHFDKQLKQTKTQKIKLLVEKKTAHFEFIIYTNGKLYLFLSLFDEKLKKKILFCQTVNKETLTLNNDLRNIIEFEYKYKTSSGNFNYRISEDKSKILLFYNLEYLKGEPEKFEFEVYDAEIKKLWSKAVSLPYTDELFSIDSYLISNGGNVFLLGKINEDKAKDVVKGKVNFRYTVLTYSNSQESVKEYGISLGDKFLRDMQIAITSKEDIICAGFYSEQGMSSIKGTYFLKIDGVTKQIISKSSKEFDLDFITLEMTEKEEDKTKKKLEEGKNIELYEYDLDNIILNDDGGAVLIGEQYYTRTTTTTTSNGGYSSSTSYYYNDIIVINISSAGNIEWAVKVAKDQRSGSGGILFFSYALHVYKNKIYVVFNDDPKNMLPNDLAPGKRYKYSPSFGDSELVIAQIDKSGGIKKKSLLLSKESGVLILPRVYQKMSDTEMMMYGHTKKGGKCFTKVTF